MLQWLVGGVWGKFASTIAAVVAGAVAIFALVFKVKRDTKKQIAAKVQERTIENIKRAQAIDDGAGSVSDGDIIDKLRDHGWLRD